MRVLVTAGAVYGPLDDNKIVSNRSRGIWAFEYAKRLRQAGHDVTLVVPDVMSKASYATVRPESVVRHRGFDDYRAACVGLAPVVDAAVMAAAVVNWIPASPVKGKMATAGHKPGDRVDIPFYLAPHVIDEMKPANPGLTLIGCKMTSGSTVDELVSAAHHTLLRARCNAVVANDLSSLRVKRIVYPDRSVFTHSDDFEGFFTELDAVLSDVHYRTDWTGRDWSGPPSDAMRLFDAIVERNRARFVGPDGMVFGSVLVKAEGGYLVSPREKGRAFTSRDAVLVSSVSGRVVSAAGPNKATLNAPLLIRVAEKYGASAVLHLHEAIPSAPTVPYAPPGTVRDNMRDIPAPAFNIDGHGFVAVVDP